MGTRGGYRNPVIPGFYPDPSVCRVGDAFVLAASSFTYFPGVPIFRSRDLVTWSQVGNALDRSSQLDLSGTEGFSSGGVLAPTIRYHDGRFWMITTVLRSRGVDSFFVTADDAAGPWAEPTPVRVLGIDPDLAWDGDGNCWVHCSAGGAGILRYRIDDHTGDVLDGPELAWTGTGLQFPEAPHLFSRANWWYLLIAEGGTERGHAVSIARAASPVGPWESCPANPILTHRSTDHPIQSTGHGDLVEAVDGSWWMVLLGTRPRGITPGYHVLGRETFLVPVDWIDGWPVPGALELDMASAPPGVRVEAAPLPRDDFDSSTFELSWVSVRVPLGDAASLTERPGWLTLHGKADGLDDPRPVFIARRQQHLRCRARARVEIADADEAGLALRMDEHAHYEVAVSEGDVIVRARIGPLVSVIARTPMSTRSVVLRLETRDDTGGLGAELGNLGAGPDRVLLGMDREDGSFEVLADLDGRYLSTEVTGGFIGRVIGIYAVNGVASFDWFELVDLDTDQ